MGVAVDVGSGVEVGGTGEGVIVGGIGEGVPVGGTGVGVGTGAHPLTKTVIRTNERKTNPNDFFIAFSPFNLIAQYCAQRFALVVGGVMVASNFAMLLLHKTTVLAQTTANPLHAVLARF